MSEPYPGRAAEAAARAKANRRRPSHKRKALTLTATQMIRELLEDVRDGRFVSTARILRALDAIPHPAAATPETL